MPDELVMVYSVETGDPVAMHTVDAAEACALGDYTLTAPDDEVSPEAKALAMARSRGMTGAPHPELQSKEERDRTRQEANDAAAAQAAASAALTAAAMAAIAPAAQPTPAARRAPAPARSESHAVLEPEVQHYPPATGAPAPSERKR
jgi:hypothetical protein